MTLFTVMVEAPHRGINRGYVCKDRDRAVEELAKIAARWGREYGFNYGVKFWIEEIYVEES